MQVLSSEFVAKRERKIINIHHGFPPAFQGAKPLPPGMGQGSQDDRSHSHFVSEVLDEGPSSPRTCCASRTRARSRSSYASEGRRAQGPLRGPEALPRQLRLRARGPDLHHPLGARLPRIRDESQEPRVGDQPLDHDESPFPSHQPSEASARGRDRPPNPARDELGPGAPSTVRSIAASTGSAQASYSLMPTFSRPVHRARVEIGPDRARLDEAQLDSVGLSSYCRDSVKPSRRPLRGVVEAIQGKGHLAPDRGDVDDGCRLSRSGGENAAGWPP